MYIAINYWMVEVQNCSINVHYIIINNNINYGIIIIITTHPQLLLVGVYCFAVRHWGSVCLSVLKWSDLRRVKMKMFESNLSIVQLHFWPWEVEVRDGKIQKSFFWL